MFVINLPEYILCRITISDHVLVGLVVLNMFKAWEIV